MGKQPCGYPDMTEWEQKHPGNIEYCCEYCGIYTAGEPRCGKCQGETKVPVMVLKPLPPMTYIESKRINNHFSNHGIKK